MQEAGRVEELAAANLKTLGGDQQDKGFDPLTTFLLQYGPQASWHHKQVVVI